MVPSAIGMASMTYMNLSFGVVARNTDLSVRRRHSSPIRPSTVTIAAAMPPIDATRW